MNKKLKLALMIGLPLIGIAAGYMLMGRTIQINVNGSYGDVVTRALTVKGALRAAGYQLAPQDRVSPPAKSWLSRTTTIELNRSRLVRIWIDPDGRLVEITTAALSPADILNSAGIDPSADDAVMVNGTSVPMDADIAHRGELTLQYRPAVSIQVRQDGETFTFRSTAQTLGQALFQQGIRIRGGDSITPLPEHDINLELEVNFTSARPIEITADGVTFTTVSSAETISQVLQTAGVTLQDLDYTKPVERNAIPGDGKIRVVRVTEELLLERTTIPYEVRFVADDTLEVNQRVVVEEGQAGVMASRVRVRYEDGVEVSRTVGEKITLSNPVARVINYGSRVTDKVMTTPNGPITYYLAVDVTATSYSPCRSGGSTCFNKAYNGMTVEQGVIGVNRAWYDIFGGSLVYVPGYGVGTIADIGAFPGTNHWIDLGYSDDDFVSWSAVNLTIYFLSPSPAAFTGVVP